jgi:filamentous hemagglutinin
VPEINPDAAMPYPGYALITLTIADASGKQEVLRTTAEHPFRVSNLQTGEGWVKAEALTVDMQLLDRHGKPLHLLKVETTGERATVYNIEVQEHHTYHVGRLGVWVHNANCCDVIGRVPTSPSFKGHISKTKLGNSSLDLDVNANQQLIISDVVANGDKFGYKTEALLHDVLNSTPGVKVLTGTKYSGEKGLDHVVQFTDAETGKLMTMVIDSKQLAKSGGTGLNPKAAGSAAAEKNLMQLSDASLKVIVNRLNGSIAGNSIDKAMNAGTLLKAVAYVDKSSGQLKIATVNVR